MQTNPTSELRWVGAEYDQACVILGMAPSKKLQQRWITTTDDGKAPTYEWRDVLEVRADDVSSPASPPVTPARNNETNQ